MLLVADSGSTKADWILINNGRIEKELYSMGFNPFFHSEDVIETELNNLPEFKSIAQSVKEIKFYGAGCSSAERNKIVQRGLQRVFPNADILVDHDVLASAVATCGDEPGISCIIGTGSNSCYYDGKKVEKNNFGLGYVLGDEASGSWLGKHLLTRYLYHTLPADLRVDFESMYGEMTKDDIIDKVYRQPNANVWLASFAIFMSEHKEHPWVTEVVRDGMQRFAELYITCYAEYGKLTVHFIGSVAFHFRHIMDEVAAGKGFTTGKYIRQPIHGLAEYFIQKQNKS